MRPIPREAYRGSQTGHSASFLRMIIVRVSPAISIDSIIFTISSIGPF